MTAALPLDLALEMWDGLCKTLQASAQERARALQFNDDMLIALFEIYANLTSLFRDPKVVCEFIREPQQKLLVGGCSRPRTIADLAFSGNHAALQTTRDYVCTMCGL